MLQKKRHEGGRTKTGVMVWCVFFEPQQHKFQKASKVDIKPGKTICQHNLYIGPIDVDTQGSEARSCQLHL